MRTLIRNVPDGAAYSPAEMFELVSGALGAADLPEADEAAAGTPPESLNQ